MVDPALSFLGMSRPAMNKDLLVLIAVLECS